MLMGFTFYVVVSALLVVFTLHSGNGHTPDQRKYGCLIAPHICTPPEDCSDDGFGGNCQVPPVKKWYLSENQISMLELILAKLEAEGHVIDYEALQDAFYDYFYSRGTFQDVPQYDQGYKVATLANYDKILLLLRKNLNKDRQSNLNGIENYNFQHQEYKRSSENQVINSKNSHAGDLVMQTLKVLRENGYKFSDLDDDKKHAIVTYLVKKLANDDTPKAATVFNEMPKLVDTGKSTDHDMKEINDKVVSTNESPSQEANFEVQEVSKDNFEDKPPVLDDAVKDSAKPNENIKKDDSSSFADVPPAPITAHKPKTSNRTLYTVIIVVGATVLLVILVTIISCCVYANRNKKQQNKKFIGSVTDDENELAGDDYQELCRQHYATKHSEQTENHQDVLNGKTSIQEPLLTRTYPVTQPNESELNRQMSGHGNPTRNSSLSSTSWSEEPVTASLDITTGHAVLSYMEDHHNNKDRLNEEWDEICGYEADNITTNAALSSQNSRKNRTVAALPYDHNRIKLKPSNNHLQSDYINASSIIDNDPKRPLYIAAQGPLSSTIPDFWQMMWEQGCVAVVMLSPLVEEGINQCARYWPDEGSCTYHNFEIHLVSEHIWCEDYLVRSLYLKHLDLGETRTVTQFHFLSWPQNRVPSTPKPLLELRRKVTKCYKGHNSPVLVHCSDGIGRTGTYILLDLAIDRMLKGAKEIDIAATLEHIRDQRMGMVGTKEQFEFALTAVAEEVNAILKSLSH